MNHQYDILVNKEHRLERCDIPRDLIHTPVPFEADPGDPKRLLRYQAARAAKYLFSQAAYERISIRGISGYRSYERQEQIYEASIERAGLAHTEQYVAPPGGSEHQTGLALDISCASMDFELEEEFGETKEGIWLREHAPFYGFILRYPKGKEHITGYSYEPWHIRYVTKPLALCLNKSAFTLEEYCEYTAASAKQWASDKVLC